MSQSVVEVSVKALVPTGNGCAVFLGTDEKVFVIQIDTAIGNAISMFMNGQAKDRPLTHDLMAMILAGLGAKVERVVINDFSNGTYFARLILVAENEIQQRKIIELDCRPSDSIALATQQGAPVYVATDVWNETEDMSDVLERIQEDKGGE
jgi:bifunctional DNase/RNase